MVASGARRPVRFAPRRRANRRGQSLRGRDFSLPHTTVTASMAYGAGSWGLGVKRERLHSRAPAAWPHRRSGRQRHSAGRARRRWSRPQRRPEHPDGRQPHVGRHRNHAAIGMALGESAFVEGEQFASPARLDRRRGAASQRRRGGRVGAGARPMPRSMRPGFSASERRKISTHAQGV